ncbi:hypothetical protein FHL15_000605 [Xylaria flabelliformis]|uniref:C2H2 type master regulator of conidiophore development brlA n=1 Tax=Xylaria flabelliformis TaxID=2512241 RepID=A0A553IE87_9PEZI|nr:hypothetical protein FHL15_000605 [Xylaria flabelliformis]
MMAENVDLPGGSITGCLPDLIRLGPRADEAEAFPSPNRSSTSSHQHSLNRQPDDVCGRLFAGSSSLITASAVAVVAVAITSLSWPVSAPLLIETEAADCHRQSYPGLRSGSQAETGRLPGIDHGSPPWHCAIISIPQLESFDSHKHNPMMANKMISRAVIARRSHALSPGAIAGAVIGSLIGGSILLLVLGFLYFRYRRKARIAQAEEALPVSQTLDQHHSASSPWSGSPRQGTGSVHLRNPPSAKDERPNGTAPVLPADTQRSPISPYGEDWMRNNQFYIQQAVGHDTLPQDIDFSLPARQQTFPIVAEQAITTPLNHASTAPEAANSSYYDPRISMDSDPVQAITPPSIQMNEMYKAQLREAEERRRSSSLHRRLWNTLTRQSTRNSKGTVGDGAHSPSIQQHSGEGSTGQPVPIKQEPGQETLGELRWQGITNYYVEEPEQISENGSKLAAQSPGLVQENQQSSHPKHSINGRQTQDSQYGGFPGRIDSTTIRQTTERDPALPSSVLSRDSTFPGLPLSAQPQSPNEQRERLKSPDIPEPMVVDGLESETNGHLPFRASHSPQLPPDSFTINPMAILHPTNPVEQAAYTTYQIKHSVSPPAMSPPAPEIVMQQPTQEVTVESLPPGDDFADMYLDLPDDDDYRRSIDSYEYPSTPGQSSTAGSSGRTPDTRPTASPSPFPTIPEHGQLKPDPGISPSSSKPSPQPGPLVCPECSREFDQIHKLNHHKRYHDRAHECTYPGCDRKFGTRTHLDRHINDRHLKLKAYHCTEPTCAWFKGGKSFPRKDNWRRHMIKKHGSTPQDFERMELSFG